MRAYLVHNNNTFGFSTNYDADKPFCSMNVIAVDYMAGGEPTTIARRVLVNTANARVATPEDCEHFGVLI